VADTVAGIFGDQVLFAFFFLFFQLCGGKLKWYLARNREDVTMKTRLEESNYINLTYIFPSIINPRNIREL